MRATGFNLELLLMLCLCVCVWVCVCVIGHLLASFSATAVSFLIILWHTRSASLPLLQPSPLPPSPLSLAGLYLLAGLRGNYHSSETLSYCTATLRSAMPPSTRTAHTYGHRQIHTHMHTCTHTQACMHTKTPPHEHRGCTTPSPPLEMLLYQPLHRLFLFAIVLHP